MVLGCGPRTVQVLRGLMGTDDKADLRERRTQARAAASAFIRHSVREMGDALGMAREATRGAAAPKPHGKKPDVSCEALHKLLGLVAVAAADDRAEAKKKLRQEVARLVAGEVTVLPAAPWPGADDAEWAAWAAVAMPHALGMLAQAGHSQRGNVAITPPSGPSVGQGSLRLDLEQMMESMGPTNGGGAIDALLAEYDPDTGERMPCLTHDGLSKLVRETVAGWSADKAHGKHAYAYTSAMDGAIFDVEEDARGLRRNSTTTEAETRRRVAEKAAELRQLADSCRQLGATEADASRLQAAVDTAAAEKLRATPAQQASVRYLAATPAQRGAAVAAWEALDSGLPEERRLERTMAAAEADMGETQPTAAPVPRGSAVGAVVLEAEEVIGAAEASTPGTAAAASAALASLKCHVEVWHKDSSMRGGAMVEGVVTGSDGACAVVESKTLSKPKKCAVDALRPPPPPPPTGWADELQAGDEVDMRSGCVWWPMRVMGKSGGLWRLRNDAYAASERDPVKPIAKLRPRWHWHADANDHSYSLKRSGERRVAALQLETGGKARVVGSGGEHDGRVAVLRERQEGGQWRARDGRSRRELIVHESLLQPTEAASPPVEPRTAEAAAREQVERWLNVTATEAEAIAASLETHAETLRQALMPREVSSPQEAAWRDARRNYADVDELRAALMAMAPGKTGASIGLEQLRVLTKAEDHILAPWLVITEMFFAGEVPDELKLGVVSPLAKDEEKFRPVVLLEPLYKVCMATMSSRVLNSLHKYGLLDSAQFGFVRDGSCHDPLKVMARLYERGRGADGEELHVAFLDATSAFDSVPHTVLDAALRRLGAPPDFISWIRAVLSGHRRKAVTAYETDADDEAIELEGGAPQGCPSSPLVWTILADYALAVMRAERGDDAVDVQFGGEVLRCLAFADDLAVAAKTREGLRARVQMLVAAMGAVGVRFNSRKSYYAWSAAAARRHQLDPAEAPADLLEVDVLDADGRWRRAALTSVPPVGDAEGETLAERGAARYLGVFFAFEGVEGEAWAEQDACTQRIVGNFFSKLALIEPSPKQYMVLVRSLLLSKVMYGGRVRLPSEEVLQEIRRKTARGAARLLRLGALGGGEGDSWSIDVELLLAPTEALGGGVPDVRAELLADIATDIVTMLHSTRAAVRAAVLPTSDGRASGEQRAVLQALHDEAGVTLHVDGAAVGTAGGAAGGAADDAADGSAAGGSEGAANEGAAAAHGAAVGAPPEAPVSGRRRRRRGQGAQRARLRRRRGSRWSRWGCCSARCAWRRSSATSTAWRGCAAASCGRSGEGRR